LSSAADAERVVQAIAKAQRTANNCFIVVQISRGSIHVREAAAGMRFVQDVEAMAG
jgi:hypothetical protein